MLLFILSMFAFILFVTSSTGKFLITNSLYMVLIMTIFVVTSFTGIMLLAYWLN